MVKESMSMNEKIRALREAKKMTQREVAKAAGMSTSAYGMIEQGRREPGREKLERLADVLDTTTDYLLGRTEFVDNIVTKADLERLLGPGDYPEYIEWIELKKYLDKQKLRPVHVKEMLESIIEKVGRKSTHHNSP